MNLWLSGQESQENLVDNFIKTVESKQKERGDFELTALLSMLKKEFKLGNCPKRWMAIQNNVL